MSKIVLSIFVCFFLLSKAHSQSWGDSTVLKHDIFYAVEVSPKFSSGSNDLFKFMAETLHVPANQTFSLMHNIVVVKLIVSPTGEVSYAKIEKGVNDECNKAVLDMISKMPCWTPGIQNGYKVYCNVTLPVILF
ncbi:energy transducer TonB [Pinibacter aurantiacus]|uniref:Energy transducer TonB n=1 Tax=Pinibacter aurantiacus TaxID=2851599 RepID=A0A9E2S803_9BACT|nr:energy transducer TonB [Pinibacter aurantiacus]MBV4358253.1 energy transducer TonB [Pinibacter aurantiacus]